MQLKKNVPTTATIIHFRPCIPLYLLQLPLSSRDVTAFIQRRYGWKWGIPAYVVSTYVGWSRVYGKKHDWWDVAAGAAIGVGSSYLFTRPFAKKHDLSISPVAGDGYCGFYTSLKF